MLPGASLPGRPGTCEARLRGSRADRGESGVSKKPKTGKAHAANPKGRPQAEIVHTSVYLPRPMWRAIRELAVARDRKAHDIMIEAIAAALERQGKRL